MESYLVAGVVLVYEDYFLFQYRDDKPNVTSPTKLCPFGGEAEQGEMPLEAAARELREETNIDFRSEDLKEVFSMNIQVGDSSQSNYERRSVFYMLEINSLEFEVYEGQSFVKIHKDKLGYTNHLFTSGTSVFVEFYTQNKGIMNTKYANKEDQFA